MAGGSRDKEGAGPALAELARSTRAGDHDRALKAATKVLATAPQDQRAFHCKVVALIQLQRFEDALTLLGAPRHSAQAATLVFERAYVLYRLDRPADALKALDGTACAGDTRLAELRAQVLYRLERHADCLAAYRALLRDSADEYEDERRANLAAVQAVAGSLAPDPPALPPAGAAAPHELLYNRGTWYVLRARWQEAERELRRAELAARADGEDEAAPARAQLALCLQRSRPSAAHEAAELYRAAERAATEPALRALLANNSLALEPRVTAFAARRRLRPAARPEARARLAAAQLAALDANLAALELRAGRPAAALEAARSLRRAGHSARAALLEAALAARDGHREKAVRVLLEEAERGAEGGERARLVLTAAQLQLAGGARSEAIRLLSGEAAREVRGRAGGAALLVTLLTADGRHEEASRLLEELGGTELPRAVWSSAAEVHARAGREAARATALDRLGADPPLTPGPLARLVKLLAPLRPQRARELAQGLPAAPRAATDADDLEASNWMMGAKLAKRTARRELSPGTPGARPPRRRARRPPPHADLSRPPDPERWLPRYERAAYRRRRGVRRDVIKGSQGLSTAATDQYDMSKLPAPAAPVPTSGAGTAPPAPRGDPPAAWQRKQQHKKKGRARKW